MQQQRLADFLNLMANKEVEIFIGSDDKRTSQMKYDAFVKVSLEKFNELIRSHVHEVSELMSKCKTISEIEKLSPEVMPKHIREAIIEQIDKQKILNIVEKTYLFLDLFRAVSSSIGTNIGNAGLHYANVIRKAGPGRIVGLNGKPLNNN